MIQESVHSSFNATFDWQSFDVALRKTQKNWSKNQFSTEWSSSIVDEKLDKNITKESYSKIAFKRTTYQNHSNVSTEMSSNRCFCSKRGNNSDFCEMTLKNWVIFKSFSQRGNQEPACPSWNHHWTKFWSRMWYFMLHIIDALPVRLAKPFGIVPLDLRNLKIKIPLCESTLLSVVIQRIVLKGHSR